MKGESQSQIETWTPHSGTAGSSSYIHPSRCPDGDILVKRNMFTGGREGLCCLLENQNSEAFHSSTVNDSFDLPPSLCDHHKIPSAGCLQQKFLRDLNLLVWVSLLQVSWTTKIAFLSETGLQWFVLSCYSHPVSGLRNFFKVSKMTRGDNKIPSSLLKSEIPWS